jgi:uncharacterized membrane protein
MKTNINKLSFGVRLFLGSFLIIFSGVMTLPIYMFLKTKDWTNFGGAIFLCVVCLAFGHWWIKRAYDKKDK